MGNVRRELETIRVNSGGVLTEEAVIKAARNEKHPLHSRFTWDDTEAAIQWRLEQARDLIRSVYVTIEDSKQKGISVRAYASLPSDREGNGGYRAISDVMRDSNLRTELLVCALAELEAFKLRYKHFVELVPVFAAIETVRRKRLTPTKANTERLQKRARTANINI